MKNDVKIHVKMKLDFYVNFTWEWRKNHTWKLRENLFQKIGAYVKKGRRKNYVKLHVKKILRISEKFRKILEIPYHTYSWITVPKFFLLIKIEHRNWALLSTSQKKSGNGWLWCAYRCLCPFSFLPSTVLIFHHSAPFLIQPVVAVGSAPAPSEIKVLLKAGRGLAATVSPNEHVPRKGGGARTLEPPRGPAPHLPRGHAEHRTRTRDDDDDDHRQNATGKWTGLATNSGPGVPCGAPHADGTDLFIELLIRESARFYQIFILCMCVYSQQGRPAKPYWILS